MKTKIPLIHSPPYKISVLNETALLVSFGNLIDTAVNDHVIALHASFTRDPFPGFIESVPAYASLAIFYDPLQVRINRAPHAFAADLVETIIRERIASLKEEDAPDHKNLVTIPVYYNGEDLEWIACQKKLTSEEVIAIHCARTYRVFMIGFLPGFAYMGAVDQRIAVPRHAAPRTKVKAGSVGIAGSQTGVYPLDSPGGWQLIGQTPLKLFNANKNPVCLLAPGDEVQFISISKEKFETQHEYPGS